MKHKLITAAVLSALSSASVMATPTDLFFSEYVEGSSNNKALEIANLTDSSIDLTDYQLEMYFNGNTNAGLTISLSGSVASNDVFVIAHSSADNAILAVADQTQGSGWFNGDDAIVLSKNGEVIDSIGQVGFDPGSQWGSGLESTQNNTLRRNLNIESGDTDTSDEFLPEQEWTGFESNTFDNLGEIDVDGGGGGNDFACGNDATMIHTIQGENLSTPINGENVEIEGIVVGDFQGSDNLRGFFVQEEDSDRDANELTAEGVFVFDNNFGVEVNLGDKVRVAGRVSEYSSMTQVSSVTEIAICENGLAVTPVVVSLPFTNSDEAEQYEGMEVVFEQTLTVSENYNLGRYGELVLSNGRLINPTNLVQPGTPANEMQQANDLSRIVLDDGSTRQNPEVIRYPQPELTAFNSVRGGDTVTNLSGVMHQAFGAYRIQPINDPDFTATNYRDNQQDRKRAPLQVASFNVLNYFNGDGQGGGYPTARGADNAEEFVRQRTKIISAIAQMDSDIVGLMEIENDGFDENSAIVDLVNGLNSATGRNYQFVRPVEDKIGTDDIAVGMIFDANKVMQIGQAATTNGGAFAEKNRQPLIQTFREIESNGEFSVVVNHFKSKGSCPSDSNDVNANQNDGQGCWNAKRTEAAEELYTWIKSKPTVVADRDILVIGDLNAYHMEDPVTTLEAKGFDNLLKQFAGDSSYSFVFQGQAGTLDHALASPTFANQIVDTYEWHINADEPRVLDYNLEFKSVYQHTSLYSEGPYRASDHDPIVIGLKMKPEADVNNDGELNDLDITEVAQNLFSLAEGNKRRYDFNRDGKIDIKDLLKITRLVNYN